MKQDFNLVVSSADIDRVLADTVPDEGQRASIRDAFAGIYESRQEAAKAQREHDSGLSMSVIFAARRYERDKQLTLEEDAILNACFFVNDVVIRAKKSSAGLPCEQYELVHVLTEQALGIYLEEKNNGKDEKEIKDLLENAAKGNFDADGKYAGPMPEPVPTLWQMLRQEVGQIFSRRPG